MFSQPGKRTVGLCACGLLAFLVAGPSRADEAEDKAAMFFKQINWKIMRDEKAPGQPVIALEAHYFFPPTDAKLKELAGLKHLKELRLVNAVQVTDAGLKHVAGLQNLQKLSLTHAPITDAGVKELAGLKHLKELKLINASKVTDVGLKTLAGFQNLQTLSLTSAKVTDAGLKELAGLKSLQWLDLGKATVTDQGIHDLQKALPECKIHWARR